MRRRFLEVIRQALDAGIDPVEATLDYLAEKDSMVSRREAKRIVEMALEASGKDEAILEEARDE